MPSDREAAGNGCPVPGRGSAGSRKKPQAEAGRAGGRSGPLLRAGSRPWGGRCACAGTAVSLPEVEGLTGESRWVSAPGGRNARESRPSAPDYHVSLRHQPLRGPDGREPLPGRASYTSLSPGPKATTRAFFASARRRGVGGTGRLPNGRAGSPGWPIVARVGRYPQQVDGPRGWAPVAGAEVGPSGFPDKAPWPGSREGGWSRPEVPPASEEGLHLPPVLGEV